jgi:hypothetical protein
MKLLFFFTLSIVPFLIKTHNVSETGFCLRLQVESAHMSLIDHPISQPSLVIYASGLPLLK